MDNELEKMRRALDEQKSFLKTATGVMTASPNGPVGLPIIEAMVAVIEAQAKEIAELKKRGVVTPT
jgi:hypothetical protein